MIKLPNLKFQTFCFILFLLGLFSLSLSYATDPDLWWHLKSGEHILQHGISHRDPGYSYTFRFAPTMPHEWLNQVGMVFLYRLGGYTALILSYALISTFAFVVIYQTIPANRYLAMLVTLLAMIAAKPMLGVRPQMVTLLFFTILNFVLYRIRSRSSLGRWKWGLPVLSVLWVNFHGGYMLGLSYVFLFCLCETFSRAVFPRSADDKTKKYVRELWLSLAGMVLGALINPAWHRSLFFPFGALGAKQVDMIAEWASPDFHVWGLKLFLVYIGGALLTFIFSPRPFSLFDGLVFTGSLMEGLYSIRHLQIFIVVVTPLWAGCAQSLINAYPAFVQKLFHGKFDFDRRKNLLNYLAVSAGILAVIFQAGFMAVNNTGMIRKGYPVDAVEYIRREKIQNLNLFHAYHWGGYLIGASIPVFIDGRVDVYGDQFLGEYKKTMELKSGWEDFLKKYKVEMILIPKKDALNQLLQIHPGWRRVYFDSVSNLFVAAAKVKDLPAVQGHVESA